MDIGRITTADVKYALGRVLAASGVEDSPLLAMAAVSERLRAGDVTPTTEAREWALVEILSQVTRTSLVRLRGVSHACGDPPATRPLVATALRADFGAGNADLEAWSCLYHHYLAPCPLQVQELAAIVMPGATHARRYISRRLARGYALLTAALREIERRANGREASAVVTTSGADGGSAVGAPTRDGATPATVRAAQGVTTASPLASPIPSAVAPPASCLTGRLPTWRTAFVGREDDVSGVAAALVPGTLVTLVGPPGAGKTRLAAEVARVVDAGCPDGTVFVELAPLVEGDLVWRAVAAALDVAETPGRTLAASLVEALAGRHALLVLDNCEHVLPACAALADALLSGCQHLRLLGTSRERLNVEGERVWRVTGLNCPDGGEAPTREAVAAAPAVRLFVDRASAADQRFRLADDNAPAVAKVCRCLDGLPLALELAAARVGAVPVEALAERMDGALGAVSTGQRKPGRRAETLGATILWSYDLLAPPQQALFVRLGVFAETWSLAAAEAVCAGGPVAPRDVFGYLTDLGDKSLVVTAILAGRVRYRFLAPVAQFARALLDAAPDATDVRDRHLAWNLALVEEADVGVRGPDQASWLTRLACANENLRAALRWARARPDADGALRLAGGLAHYWQIRGFFAEGRAHLAAALAMDGAAGGDCSAAATSAAGSVRARALEGAGMLARAQCDYPAARAYLAEVIVIRRRQGDEAGAAGTLRQLGAVADEQGAADEAVALFRESLEAYRVIGDRWGAAAALNSLGLAIYHQGRYEEARPLIEEGLALFRAVGETWAVGVTTANLGNVAFDQGDLEGAVRCYDESLSIARHMGDEVGVAQALTGLGHVALRRGDATTARRRYVESGRILLEVDDRRELAEVMEFLAGVDEAEDDLTAAARLLGSASALRETIGAPLLEKERPERAARLNTLALRLGTAAFDAAWTEGRRRPWHDVAAEVLRH